MDCNFVVGQKVVCVDADLHEEWDTNRIRVYDMMEGLDGLTKNEIYTIRGFTVDYGNIIVYLDEITRKLQPDTNIEAGYHHARFRPLRDLTIFHDILRKANVPSRELSGTDA
jgi:hypothetical protein